MAIFINLQHDLVYKGLKDIFKKSGFHFLETKIHAILAYLKTHLGW